MFPVDIQQYLARQQDLQREARQEQLARIYKPEIRDQFNLFRRKQHPSNV